MEKEKFVISPETSIADALKKIDAAGYGFVIVVAPSDEKVVGVLTDADLRHVVLQGGNINSPSSSVMNRNFACIERSAATDEKIKEIFDQKRYRMLPILEDGRLHDIVIKEVFNNRYRPAKKQYAPVGIPLVIMAGGKGTRLSPFTAVLPKPLVPINDKPIIEIIIDEFLNYTVRDVILSVNDKAEIIKAYVRSLDKPCKIQFVQESMPLGTGGALRLMKGMLKGAFFVSNCDVIIKADYHDMLKYHQAGSYKLTLVGARQSYTVPYGVCELGGSGGLARFVEKPSQDIIINTGMYIVESSLIDMIPPDTCFNMTQLIEKMLETGDKIGVYCIDSDKYFDIGQWDEYKKTIKHFNQLVEGM